MISYPYGSEAAIYKGNAYNTFSRKFLEWFFEDEKCKAPFELTCKKEAKIELETSVALYIALYIKLKLYKATFRMVEAYMVAWRNDMGNSYSAKRSTRTQQ